VPRGVMRLWTQRSPAGFPRVSPTSVEFGLTIFLTETTISAPDLGRALEDYGFESLFLPDHSHIPASRETPYAAGGELPEEYWHLHDPLMAHAAIASVTSRLRLGLGLLVMTERDPITTAKQVATLDHLSSGRLLVGVGPGWNEEAMRNHGVDPSHKSAVFVERVKAMQVLWTQDEAEFHGRHVDFQPAWMWPKPIQRPHPPVLVGGYGPRVLDRVVEFGDGWLASGLHLDVDSLRSRVAELRVKAEAAGRGPLPVSVQQAIAEPEAIEAYQAMGVSRCIFRLQPFAPGDVIEQVRRYAALLRHWR
jgi:probable F420-dependent oxidoreductase